mgnify:CR=1 FL=1
MFILVFPLQLMLSHSPSPLVSSLPSSAVETIPIILPTYFHLRQFPHISTSSCTAVGIFPIYLHAHAFTCPYTAVETIPIPLLPPVSTCLSTTVETFPIFLLPHVSICPNTAVKTISIPQLLTFSTLSST